MAEKRILLGVWLQIGAIVILGVSGVDDSLVTHVTQCAADTTYCIVDLLCSVDDHEYVIFNTEFKQCNNTFTTVRLFLPRENNNTLECCLKSQTYYKDVFNNYTFLSKVCHMLQSNYTANNNDWKSMTMIIGCTVAIILVLLVIGVCIILFCWIRKKRRLMIPPRPNRSTVVHTHPATEDYVTVHGHRSPARPRSNSESTASSNHYTQLCTDNRDYLSIYATVDRVKEASESASLIQNSITNTCYDL